MPKRRPLDERLWEKVDRQGPVPEYAPELGPCWLWTGALTYGYGVIGTGVGKQLGRVHRITYEWVHGPIPAGLHLDHLCRVRNCCRPDHLEAVTPQVNIHRGIGWAGLHHRATHCTKGHPYAGDNLVYDDRGRRCCRACDGNVGSGHRNSQKTHCPQGHPYDEANTYPDPRGTRGCRACRAASDKRWRG